MASGDLVEGLGTAGTPVGGVVSVNIVGGGSSGPVDVTDRAGRLLGVVSGTVAVSNFPATQPVSGTVGVNNFPATQPVSLADNLARILGQIINRPVDSALVHAPAINVIATVTFPATVGKRWVLSYAHFFIDTNAATAGAPSCEIVDGATQVFSTVMSVPATAFANDKFTLYGPIPAAVNAALIVRFTAAGGATILERVSAGAWLV